ncbi:MAG: hypothetical protein O7A62_00300, partial [Alphaproteobacteria bacterium]|nr:hypothetical protein [Alphaproteobacteria bacterium]
TSKWDQMGYHGNLWAVNEETTNKWLKTPIESKKIRYLPILFWVVFAFVNAPPNEQSHENMAIVCSCNVLTWSKWITVVDNFLLSSHKYRQFMT